MKWIAAIAALLLNVVLLAAWIGMVVAGVRMVFG